MSAAHNQEGEWIAWTGGSSPVGFDRTTRVDVRLRDGTECPSRLPIICGWIHHGWPDDVLAYRVHP